MVILENYYKTNFPVDGTQKTCVYDRPDYKLMYFEDPNDPRNIALEKFRKKIGEFIEAYDKESPLIHQWPASIET